MEFRKKLEEWMNRKEITKAELARRSGLSESLVGQIVSGVKPNPTIETILKLADGLDVSPAVFFIDENYFVTTIADILLPHLSDEDRAFVLSQDSRDFIVLARDFHSSDLPPESIKKIISSYLKISQASNKPSK